MEALGHSNDEQAIKNRSSLLSVEGGNGSTRAPQLFTMAWSMHSRRHPQARAVQLWLDRPIERTNRQTPIELPEVGDALRLLENDPRVVGGGGAGWLALVQHSGV